MNLSNSPAFAASLRFVVVFMPSCFAAGVPRPVHTKLLWNQAKNGTKAGVTRDPGVSRMTLPRARNSVSAFYPQLVERAPVLAPALRDPHEELEVHALAEHPLEGLASLD